MAKTIKLLLICLIFSLQASVYLCAQTVYYVTPNGAGNQNGTSWSNAMSNLQVAIEATSTTGGGQVWVKQGTYYPGSMRTDHFTLKNGVEIYGGFNGTESLLSQRNWQNNLTILSGDIGALNNVYDNSYKIIKNEYTASSLLDSTAIFDGFIISNGYDDSEDSVFAGGLYNSYASPKIQNCRFNENGCLANSTIYYVHANCYGGAMYNSNSSPKVYNCDFVDNTCLSDSSNIGNANGGAVYNVNSSPVFTSCTFTDNIVDADTYDAYSYGGAVYNMNSSPTFDFCTFNSNMSKAEDQAYAGAIYNNNSPAIITNCSFTSNETSLNIWTTYYSYGGAICNENSASIIDNCSFNSNTAKADGFGHGGAIHNDESTPEISNCTFIGNESYGFQYGYGGAIHNESCDSSSFINCIFIANNCDANNYSKGGAISNVYSASTWINCSFSNNSATSNNYAARGGGICNYYSSECEVFNSSFSNNIAEMGGAIFNEETAVTVIKNSILWGNEGNDYYSEGGIDTILYSCVGGIVGGLGNFDLNPNFTDPENNDLHLSCFSPCINQGADSLVPSYITYDLEGNNRIIADTVDMGAYENTSGPPIYTNVIYVKPDGNGCGTTWDDPLGDINDAIELAWIHTQTNDTMQVWVAQGTYHPGSEREDYMQLQNQVEVYGGFTGSETQLSQRDWKNNLTIISANIGDTSTYYDNNYRLFKNEFTESNSVNSSAVLDGFILKDGYCNEGPKKGGAIFNKYASPTINNCTFISNTIISSGGSAYGGAIYNIQSSPKINNCKFIGNYLDSWSINNDTTCGGAICNFYSIVEISNCMFISNNIEASKYSYGGAIFNKNSTVYLTNCLFSLNTSSNGAGYTTYGGAICNQDSTYLEMFNCTLTKNIADDLGGMYSDEGSIGIVVNSIFWGNSEGNLNFNDDLEITYSCVEDGAIGTGNIDLFPEFIDYTNNIFALSCFSPCLNGGSTNLIPEIEIDLEGNLRIVNDTIDMGAYEFQDNYPPEYFDNRIYVRSNCIGCGTSWEDAAGDLINALIRAGEMASLDNPVQVWVGEGEYFPGEDREDHFIMQNNVEIYGGFFGTETQLSQRNWIIHPTILSGNIGDTSIQTDNSYQIIKNEHTDQNPLTSSAILDGFIITGGYYELYDDIKGSGMYNYYASPVIRNCRFTHNTSVVDSYNSISYGGAIYNSYSSPLVINCEFISNLSLKTGINSIASYGGAIANFEHSNLILINSSFADNYAQYGGAISNHAYSSCTVINCTFANNDAGTGGAIQNKSDGELEIINSIFWGNTDENIINWGEIEIQYSRIDAEFSGIGNIDDDPLFEDLLNNDFHLLSLSPCINTGTPDTTGLNLPPHDLEGNSRILEGNIDMGCYEFNPETPPQPEIIYVSLEGGGFGGSSWNNPLYNLQDAINMASSLAQGGDTMQIWVVQGTYHPGPDRDDYFELKNQVEVYGGFNGSEIVLSQRDWINNPTILSANIGDTSVATDNNYRIFYNNYTESNLLDSSALLDGFILKNGYCDVWPFTGGAMVNKFASPTVNNCTFISNSILGGINNSSYGGAIYNYQSSLEINNCGFFNNYAYTTSLNDSACGGAISNYNSSIIINNSLFEFNSVEAAENSFGGAVSNINSSLILANCIFSSNTSSINSKNMSYGGGICNHEYSGLELVNCLFADNSGSSGGAISNFSSANSRIINSTIANNIANSGGGLLNFNDSYLDIFNCILWENTGSNLINLGEVNVQYSCIEEVFPGTGNIYEDPMFVDIVNNDFHLSWQSPCISAGTQDTTGLNLPIIDLDGNPRIIGSAVDMGCYEYPYATRILSSKNKFFIEVYPNPSSNFIRIEYSDDLTIKKLEIIDIYGNIVRRSNYISKELDISNLSNGIYILNFLLDNEKQIVRRFIKK